MSSAFGEPPDSGVKASASADGSEQRGSARTRRSGDQCQRRVSRRGKARSIISRSSDRVPGHFDAGLCRPWNAGSRFSTNATPPSRKSSRAPEGVLELRLEVELVVEVGVDHLVERLLGARVGAGGPRGQRSTSAFASSMQLVVGVDGVDRGPSRAPAAAATRSPSSAIWKARALPTAAGTNSVEPPSGISPMFTNASPKKAGLGGQHQVAGERERAADAHRGAVDRGHDRLLEPPHADDDRVVDLVELACGCRACRRRPGSKPSLRSAPEEKPRPAPVISTARTDGSAAVALDHLLQLARRTRRSRRSACPGGSG